MKTKYLLLCALFSALTAIGSLFKIPLNPALIFTLQTFFVFLSGLLLRPRYALISQLVYAAIGLLGLPVFSKGGGLAYVFEPSFGYIIGFCTCAFMVSLLVRKNLIKLNSTTERKRKYILAGKVTAYSLASVFAMYIIGITYMYLMYNFYLGTSIALWPLIISSTGIFILLDIAKFALAIPLSATVLKRMPKEFLLQN